MRRTKDQYSEKQTDVPITDKFNLTITEASVYFNIGTKKLREMVENSDCDFVLKVGVKTLIKRKKLEEYLLNRVVV